MALSREQKVAKASRLKAKGVRVEAIARSLGTPYGTVVHWTKHLPWPVRGCYVCGGDFEPKHGNQKTCCGESARKRYHEQHTRSACEDCGSPLQPGSGYPSSTVRRCVECEQRRRAERVDARARRIEREWAAGRSSRQIADSLGWSLNQLSTEMVRLREKGYALPYRYAKREGGFRFPEQVAA